MQKPQGSPRRLRRMQSSRVSRDGLRGVDEDTWAELGVGASRKVRSHSARANSARTASQPPGSVNGPTWKGGETSLAPDEAREYFHNELRLQEAFRRHGNGGHGFEYPFMQGPVLTVGLT
ncbi:hypothetical protein DL768_008487 [Monosporascus sp. mg162]|nr:hypothetical protein DL768_008487 [Monosporascus sp. mg162]